MTTEAKTTECGVHFEHIWHLYRTDRGKVKTCDGTFRENKK